MIEIKYTNKNNETLKFVLERENGDLKIDFPKDCTKELSFEFMCVFSVFMHEFNREHVRWMSNNGIELDYVLENAEEMAKKISEM